MHVNYVVGFSNLQIFPLNIQPDHYIIKAGCYYNIKDKYFKMFCEDFVRLKDTEKLEQGRRAHTHKHSHELPLLGFSCL